MIIFDCLHAIKRENKILYWLGLFNLGLFFLALILYFVDAREIMGINAWIKPMKFGLSVFVYSWTFGWLLQYIPALKKKQVVSWGIAICMVVENGAIFFQATRGEISHYNVSSAMNAIIFSTMGLFISINSLLNFYVLILFFTEKLTTDNATAFAWRTGLFLFLVGGIAGGLMIGNMAHTVGAPDGGEGLPFLNWSTVVGDLRAAHFVTMHGLQAIPLFAFFISRKMTQPLTATGIFFLLYSLVCLRLHLVALNQQPFFNFF